MALKLTPVGRDVILLVKVVPGASRDRVAGVLGETLKVTTRQPPESGRANRAVLELLAEALSVHVSSLSILRGQTSARKEILIRGMTEATVRQRFQS